MARVSSTDSVVWVTTATRSGSRSTRRSTSSTVSTRCICSGACPERADDLDVPPVTDEQDLVAFSGVTLRFQVHLGHQRTGGVHHAQTPCSRFLAYGRGNPVSAEDEQAAVRHLCQVLHETGAAGAQLVHHVPVVNDLVSDVDRWAVSIEHQVDDLDRVRHTGTEAARTGHQDGALGTVAHGLNAAILRTAEQEHAMLRRHRER